jgi:hypothetical protein
LSFILPLYYLAIFLEGKVEQLVQNLLQVTELHKTELHKKDDPISPNQTDFSSPCSLSMSYSNSTK